MKKIILITVLGCLLQGCATYKAYMSEASKDPLPQQLPRMEFDWFSSGNVKGANEDFVKTIVRNEINQNIISQTGLKQGRIEVKCEQLSLKSNMALPFLSGLTLFSFNLLGMPFSTSQADVSLLFSIVDASGTTIDTFKYTASKKSAAGLYYGKDASICMVEATKEVMKKFRDDVNSKSSILIAKLDENKDSASDYFAQTPVQKSSMQTNTSSAKQSKNRNSNNRNKPSSDVDINIPVSKPSSDNTFVLIIANENYEFVDDVQFALNDGDIFREYCIKTLGVPERQIFLYKNASLGIIAGGVDKMLQAMNIFDEVKAIVYYCGHGIPDEKTGDAYIVPVDGKGTNTATCYSLNQLYKTMASAKTSNVTYFMDACFTGANRDGSMLVAARGVAREAKKEVVTGNTVVFSAASGDETAMPFAEKGHGMFTYFLLKKLQETKGDVTYGELAEYINKNVKKEAFLSNEKPQNPVVATSEKLSASWKNIKMR